MSKTEQILVLEPATELKFKGPYTSVVTSELKLTNPAQKKVLFKVKTTAPKCYCVRPNSGIIEPGAFAIVSVMLQPFDHSTAEKSKHKFMVQSLFAPDGTIENHDHLWKEAAAFQLMDSKLKCVFEPVDGVQNVNLGREEIVKPVYNKEVTAASPTGDILPSIKISSDAGKLTKSPATSDVTDVGKMNKDCQALNAEIQRLSRENDTLRNEGVRLRKVAMSQSVSVTPQPSPVPSIGTTTSANVIPSAVYLVVFFILGLLIGKLLL